MSATFDAVGQEKIACKGYWDKYLSPTDSRNPHQYSSCTEFSRKTAPMQKKLIECLNGLWSLGVYVLTYFLHHPSAHIAGLPGGQVTVTATRRARANLRGEVRLKLVHDFFSLEHIDAVALLCTSLQFHKFWKQSYFQKEAPLFRRHSLSQIPKPISKK